MNRPTRARDVLTAAGITALRRLEHDIAMDADYGDTIDVARQAVAAIIPPQTDLLGLLAGCRAAQAKCVAVDLHAATETRWPRRA
jgi:hypothetical protein